MSPASARSGSTGRSGSDRHDLAEGKDRPATPRCSLSVATHEFDLVVEGGAHLVTDRAIVADIAEQWAAGGWPCRVDESGEALTADFSAPSAGPPPWLVSRLTLRDATALQNSSGWRHALEF